MSVWLVAASLFIVVSCSPPGRSAALPRPRARLTKVEAAPGGQDLAREVHRVENRGDVALVLGPVRTSCGCTGATIRPDIVPPGGAAEVVVEGRVPARGQKLVRISIPTNDPEQRELMIDLKLERDLAPPMVVSSSAEVSFGVIRPDVAPQPQATTIDVLERRDQPRAIHAIRSSNPAIRVEQGPVEELPNPDPRLIIRRYPCRIAIDRPPGPGPIAGDLTFCAGDEAARPIATLAVRGFARPFVAAVPASLSFTASGADRPRALTLSLICCDPDFVLSARCVSAWLALELRPKRVQGHRIAYDVAWTGPLDPTMPDTKLRFATNFPGVPEIEVPVHLIINAPASDATP